jgi:hypothetical protein
MAVTKVRAWLVLERHQEVVVAYREGSARIAASHAFPPGG